VHPFDYGDGKEKKVSILILTADIAVMIKSLFTNG
jgi:hypothetical protein